MHFIGPDALTEGGFEWTVYYPSISINSRDETHLYSGTGLYLPYRNSRIHQPCLPYLLAI